MNGSATLAFVIPTGAQRSGGICGAPFGFRKSLLRSDPAWTIASQSSSHSQPDFAIASRWMFAPELQSGEVVSILNDWTLPPLDLWVIYPSGRLASTKAHAFAKWFEGIIA